MNNIIPKASLSELINSRLNWPDKGYFRLFQLVLKHDFSEDISARLLSLYPRDHHDILVSIKNKNNTKDMNEELDREYIEAFESSYKELSSISYSIMLSRYFSCPSYVFPDERKEAPKNFDYINKRYSQKNKYRDLMRIVIQYVDKDDFPVKGHEDDFESYYAVNGKNGVLFKDDTSLPDEVKYRNGKDDPMLKEEIVWALDFSTWSDWLTWRIDSEVHKNFSEVDIICHCLWEMTFMGFDEKSIKNKCDSLFKRVNKVKKALKDGKMDEFKTMEDVKKEIEKKLKNKTTKVKKEKK